MHDKRKLVHTEDKHHEFGTQSQRALHKKCEDCCPVVPRNFGLTFEKTSTEQPRIIRSAFGTKNASRSVQIFGLTFENTSQRTHSTPKVICRHTLASLFLSAKSNLLKSKLPWSALRCRAHSMIECRCDVFNQLKHRSASKTWVCIQPTLSTQSVYGLVGHSSVGKNI